MSVNGVRSSTGTYAAYSASAKSGSTSDAAKVADKNVAAEAVSSGVVYEPSAEASKVTTREQDRSAIVQKLKADVEARTSQLQQIVQDMLAKQGSAYGAANDIWKFLASGNFTVDPQTKAQAQADIAEDGYWGVKQTSERIFDFAMALAGDDEEKMQEMKEAYEKGFKLAQKKWGGKLPQISQDTNDAVLKKFDEYFAGKQSVAEQE